MKGSLTSVQVAEAISQGIKSVIPSADIVSVPIADGGEGTTKALVTALHGHEVEVRVHSPLGAEVTAHYGIVGDTAIIEMAQAAGLELIPPQLRNPMKTTTRGVGEMILDALNCGCRHIIMCIGGSTTNDGGMGMLTALGSRFLDINGRQLPGIGASLAKVASIKLERLDPRIKDCHIEVACDVDNPLYGPDGAAYIFARQKGADDKMIAALDRGLRNYGLILNKFTGIDIASMPGAGAAGGMGAGLLALLHAQLLRGIDLVLDAVDFDHIIKGSDLIITGEGHIDAQTLNGKAPLGVLRRGQRAGVPVIAVAGALSDEAELLHAGFSAIFPIADPSLDLAHNMDPTIATTHLIATATHIANALKRQL